MSVKSEWLLEFENLCVPQVNCSTLLDDPINLKVLFNKTYQLQDKHINKIIDKNVCNIQYLFANIDQQFHEIPPHITQMDIYLYFCDHFFNHKDIDIWESYFSPVDNVPERVIITLITRLKLMEDKHKPELEALRYSLLYCIFNFHYENLQFIERYNNILLSSTIYKDVVTENKPLYEYIKAVHHYSDVLIKKHMNISSNDKLNLDYKTIFEEVVEIYKGIAILEKIVYFIMCKNQFCMYHIIRSLFKYNKKAHSTFMTHKKYEYCTCHMMKPNPETHVKFVDELGRITQTLLQCIEEGIPCIFSIRL